MHVHFGKTLDYKHGADKPKNITRSNRDTIMGVQRIQGTQLDLRCIGGLGHPFSTIVQLNTNGVPGVYNTVVSHLMYGVLAGMWYLAPGSKSSSDLSTGGDTPWYRHLKTGIKTSAGTRGHRCEAIPMIGPGVFVVISLTTG